MTEKAVLEGESITGSAKEMPNGTQIIKVVSQMPMAFGVAAAAAVNGKTKEISSDGSVSQPLILVTHGSPRRNNALLLTLLAPQAVRRQRFKALDLSL